MALQFEAKKVALKQDRSGFILTLCLHPDQIPEELLRDFVGARYACAMVRLQDDETPVPYKNRVQQAAIMCKHDSFQLFVGGTDEVSAADALCVLCGIESRAELNGNKVAQQKFDQLMARYEETHDPF